MPTSESLITASMPRSLNSLQVSLAASMYGFPYNAVESQRMVGKFIRVCVPISMYAYLGRNVNRDNQNVCC